MKIRLIPKKTIEKAYIKEDIINFTREEETKDIDDLPEEAFKIIGEILSFMEEKNNLLEAKNENK